MGLTLFCWWCAKPQLVIDAIQPCPHCGSRQFTTLRPEQPKGASDALSDTDRRFLRWCNIRADEPDRSKP